MYIYNNIYNLVVLCVYIYIYIYKTLVDTTNLPTSFGRGHSHGACFLYDF